MEETHIIKKTIDDLEIEVEMSGFIPGSLQFFAVLRAKKVETCKNKRQVLYCNQCAYYEECSLIREHMMDLTFGIDRHNKND